MVIAVNIVVIMKSGVILLDMVSWSRGSMAGIQSLRNSLTLRFEGLIQRVRAYQMRRPTCRASKPMAKGRERNVDSGTKRQFTVHL